MMFISREFIEAMQGGSLGKAPQLLCNNATPRLCKAMPTGSCFSLVPTMLHHSELIDEQIEPPRFHQLDSKDDRTTRPPKDELF